MILTLTFPDANAAELEKIVEELEAADIELASQAPADLQLPGWHDISVALGSSGLVTAFYHIVQTWLNRNAGQKLILKSDDGIEVTFSGGSPHKVEGILKALATEKAAAKERRYGSKKGKTTTAKRAAKKPAKKAAKRPAKRTR